VLASEILKGMCTEAYEIQNEKEFDVLALCAATVERPFCTFIDDTKYIRQLSKNATMVVVTPEVAGRLDADKYGMIVTKNPRLLYFKLHNELVTREENYVIKRVPSVVASSAKVSNMAYIAEENVVIGENVVIEPFVTIYPNVTIGDNTIIRSGCRIGGEGFEYKKENDHWLPVKHAGSVRIGKNVEVQNNSCIDKAVYPWDSTVLEDNVKVDNLVHIAHGVKIGEYTHILAQCNIAGRTVIGKSSWIGGNTTISNGLVIGDNVKIHLGSVVIQSLPDGANVSGNFARDHWYFMGQYAKELRNIKKEK